MSAFLWLRFVLPERAWTVGLLLTVVGFAAPLAAGYYAVPDLMGPSWLVPAIVAVGLLWLRWQTKWRG